MWIVDKVRSYAWMKTNGNKIYCARIIWLGVAGYTSQSPRYSKRTFRRAEDAVTYGKRWSKRMSRQIVREGVGEL